MSASDLPAAISIAPENAAKSAAVCSWRLSVYHSPVSTPSPANPSRTAMITATTPK